MLQEQTSSTDHFQNNLRGLSHNIESHPYWDQKSALCLFSYRFQSSFILPVALLVELVTHILTDSWTDLTYTEDHIKTFRNLSLVSKQWAAIIKEVNSMHSLIPLSYNAGQLYTIKSLSSISNPLLCRTLTFRVEYVVMPQRVMIIACEPSIAVNKGIERILRKLFYGPNTPRHRIHIFVDYLDDSQVHIPSFWIPPPRSHG